MMDVRRLQVLAAMWPAGRSRPPGESGLHPIGDQPAGGGAGEGGRYPAAGAYGCVLIRCDGGGTSRNDLVGQVIRDDAHRLPLDRLSSDSSLDKLRRLLGTDWSWGIPGSVV